MAYRTAEQKAKHAERMREYYRASPEARAKRAVNSKAYHAAHKLRRAEISRKHARKKAGASSPSAAWKIGQCEICTLPSGDLHWDHDHATGAHRGWLCHNCNVALGLLRDSPLVLKAALHYLETTAA